MSQYNSLARPYTYEFWITSIILAILIWNSNVLILYSTVYAPLKPYFKDNPQKVLGPTMESSTEKQTFSEKNLGRLERLKELHLKRVS